MLRIVTYHDIGTSLGAIRRQVASLSKRYEIVKSRDFARSGEVCSHWAKKALMFTFDDAYEDHLEVGRCFAEDFGISATFFIPTGLLDCATAAGQRRFITENLRANLYGRTGLSWQQCLELYRLGHCIGSHGVQHMELRDLSSDLLHQEILGSKMRIQELLGVTPVGFAAPYGRFTHISAAALRAVLSAYSHCYMCIPGLNMNGNRLMWRDRIEPHWSATQLHLRLGLFSDLRYARERKRIRALVQSIL
jgi:peptidoglycan/xylan/chitin deacetylase (PgdA/CDA1 family)